MIEGWPELIATALLGTERRPPQPAALAGWPGQLGERAAALSGDPAAVLLDAAALASAYRQAGALPVRLDLATARPPAPDHGDEPLSAVSRPAAQRLAGLLAVKDVPLLGAWLRAAASAGRRAPAGQLPALLDQAAATPALRPLVAAVLGRRGHWLAAQRPGWAALAAGGNPGGDDHGGVDDHGVDPAGRERWDTGDRAQRLTWLRAARRADPAAARAVLRSTWRGERATDRAEFLGLLADTLDPDDEELLDAALDDRSAAVRSVAATQLSRLPESAFAARMAARALSCLRVSGEGGQARLRIVADGALASGLDRDADRDADRDGLTDDGRPAGIGPAAWLLMKLLAATPLRTWSQLLGGPADALAARIDVGWEQPVRVGWTWAAIGQRDEPWAAALLAAGIEVRATELLGVLGPDRRAAHAADLIRRWAAGQDSSGVLAVLESCPPPWPSLLTVPILQRLPELPALLSTWQARQVLWLLVHGAAVDGSPPDPASMLAVLERVAGAAHDEHWRLQLGQAAETLTQRVAIIEELR